MTTLRDKLGVTVGYSDHTLGIGSALVALGLGARIVEKHFTLDKNYSSFRDHALSAEPAEFAELAKAFKASCGDGRHTACATATCRMRPPARRRGAAS